MSERRYADFSPEERAVLFHESYGDGLDGARTFEHVLAATGDFLSKLANTAAADAAMTALLNIWLDADIEAQDEWRRYVEDKWSSFFSETDEGAAMHDLLAYAEYGIVLHRSNDKDELERHIAALIEQTDAFWQAIPFKQWHLEEHDEISPLLTWAKGRWALDHGEPIEPAALARLGRVSERSVRNLMSKKEKGLRSENGKVPAQDALDWLSARPDYWNSVWQQQELGELYPSQNFTEESYVFVPVSRDGSIFHPGLRGNQGYRVGAKDQERDFASFEDALTALQSLSKPYWRRQNANGSWVLISGVRWERLSESDLQKFADDPERRLQSAL